MDCETVKILILRKILSVFVPKIFNYHTLLNGPNTYSWQPNYYLLDEHQRPSEYSDISTTFIIERHSDGGELKIDFIKTIHHGGRNRPRGRFPFRRLEEEIEEENRVENINFSFNKIESAIPTIIKHLDVRDLNRMGLAAMLEIDTHENPKNLSIGTIKTILGIHTDVDLLNLETRRVLLERIT